MSKRKATTEGLSVQEIEVRKKNVEKVLSWRSNLTGWAKEELRLKNNWSSKKSLQKARLHKKKSYINGSSAEKEALDRKWEQDYSETKLQEFLREQKKKYEELHGSVPPKTRGWSTVEKRLGKQFNPNEEMDLASSPLFRAILPPSLTKKSSSQDIRLESEISYKRSQAWLDRWENRAKKESELEEKDLDIEEEDEWEDEEEWAE
jgi:hypothetical protein